MADSFSMQIAEYSIDVCKNVQNKPDYFIDL